MILNIKADIVKSINGLLKSFMFVKKGDSWFYMTNDVIWVFNLQKSIYWDEFFINIWIFFRDFDRNILFPKYSEWHVWSRLEMLIDDEQLSILKSCLNFKDLSFWPVERYEQLNKIIKNTFVNIVRENNSLMDVSNLLSISVKEKLDWKKTRFMIKWPGMKYVKA
jgi:hypothetical protein